MLHIADTRQDQILSLLHEKQFVDIKLLTKHFKVSVATIRRDLADLEEGGLLRRTHGGAVSINQVAQDPSHASRAISHLKEKATIAEVAAEMIVDGDVVFLDAGTTALEVTKLIAGRSNLTFISNGADIVAELIRNNANKIYSVGGEFTDSNRSFQGPLAEQFIRQFSADKLILNASSIDLDRGLICTASPQNASVQRAMLEVSGRIIVVADHSKFAKSSLSVTAKIEDVSAIVTDAGAQSIIDTVPEEMRGKFVVGSDKSKPSVKLQLK